MRSTDWECLDWIHLAQNMDQWPALVNTEINVRFYKRRDISWPDNMLLALQEGLFSIYLPLARNIFLRIKWTQLLRMLAKTVTWLICSGDTKFRAYWNKPQPSSFNCFRRNSCHFIRYWVLFFRKLFNDAFSIETTESMIWWLINDELERILKEADVA
jgi:hypothetical protein